MIIVDNCLVSEDILEKEFVCNLKACKGACCIEGDSGAPLDDDELNILKQEYKNIAPYLSEEGKAAIEQQGVYMKDTDGDWVTPLINGKECAYTIFEADGTAKCGIEQAYYDGKTTYKKPISCHLYPIRLKPLKDFTALNYDIWNICSEACVLGQQLKVNVFEFLKEPLIRKFGEEWYNNLLQVAEIWKAENKL